LSVRFNRSAVGVVAGATAEGE